MFERPNLGGRERPWEAVGGRGALIGLEICVRESQIFEANQSPTASHGLSRPLTICHVICLSQSGEHGLSRTRPLRSVRPWESEMPIGLTDLRVRSASHAHRSDSTGRSNAFSREISQIAPRIGLSAGVVRSVCVRGQSDSQICEAVGVRKSCDLSESPK